MKRLLLGVIFVLAAVSVAYADYYPATRSGSIINIGQAFGTIAAPYINALVGSLIVAFVGWVCNAIRQKTGIAIDQYHRDALTKALQNQAGSLIADGVVAMQGKTVTVTSPALAAAATDLLASIPDAAKHFGLTPDYVAKRIVDMIPQIAAGAQIVAAAHKPPPTLVSASKT